MDLQALENAPVRPIEFSFSALEAMQDKDGETALMKAAAHGDSNVVRAMLRNRTGPVGLRDKKGQSALFHAVENGRIDFLKEMVEFKNAVIGTGESYYPRSMFLDPEDSPWTRSDGKTVIQRAEELGEREIAGLLRRQLDDFIELDSDFIAKGGKGLWIYYRHRGAACEARGDDEKAEADFREVKRLGAAGLSRL